MTAVAARPLAENLADASSRPHALLALGIPRCPACMLLPPSLGEIASARPDLWVGLSLFADPDDWAQREHLLWPRGVHVSRSAVPVLALMSEGRHVASRPGGAPAHVIDAWLTQWLGPAQRPVAGRTVAEEDAIDVVAARKAQHTAVKNRDGCT